MTSWPASRRARATILAPRSWPSRPGLPTTMRIRLFVSLEVMVAGYRKRDVDHAPRLHVSDRRAWVDLNGELSFPIRAQSNPCDFYDRDPSVMVWTRRPNSPDQRRTHSWVTTERIVA